MIPRMTRNGQYGSTAATLLVAYLFILQGLAAGVVTSSRGAGLYADSICLSKGSGPLDGGTGGPIRSSRHGDACCIVHCATLGGATTPPSQGASETPPALSHVAARLAFEQGLPGSKPATPPLGSRAPPALI